MTIKQDILAFLQSHPDGIDDDELAEKLGLKARQQANSRCRQLENEGLVVRKLVNGKIKNFPTGLSSVTLPTPNSMMLESMPKSELWFWEGNVQAKVVQFLVRQGYHIDSQANTASHDQGKDIVANKEGKVLWVTVKGFPKGTLKTSPSTQAGHWFSHAIFDILSYRGECKEVNLGVALPDFPRYRKLTQRISWLKPVANFTYYWVKESGEVTVE